MNFTEALSPELAFIIPALWIIGYYLKHYSNIPNWAIVWLLLALAVIAAVITIGFSIEGIVQGIIASAVATLGHQLIKQTAHDREIDLTKKF